MQRKPVAEIVDETDGWGGCRLAWKIDFGSIKDDKKREEERARIEKGLEKALKELGYEPDRIPSL